MAVNPSVPDCDYIEPVLLGPNLIYFYWGRHPEHENIDMRLGGGLMQYLKGIRPLLSIA